MKRHALVPVLAGEPPWSKLVHMRAWEHMHVPTDICMRAEKVAMEPNPALPKEATLVH
jgi:hypothetical protein